MRQKYFYWQGRGTAENKLFNRELLITFPPADANTDWFFLHVFNYVKAEVFGSMGPHLSNEISAQDINGALHVFASHVNANQGLANEKGTFRGKGPRLGYGAFKKHILFIRDHPSGAPGVIYREEEQASGFTDLWGLC